jgi:CrcB protein
VTLLLVAVGGAVGAPLRYLTDRAITTRLNPVFPWGTLMVNIAASLLLGILTGAATALPPQWYAGLGAGLAGALSTYSTFGYETVRLIQDRAHRHAVASVAGNLAGTLGAAAIGLWLGATLTG